MKNVNLLCMFSGALLLAAAQVGCGDDTGTGGTGGSAGGSGGSGAQGGSGASGAQGGGGATSTGGSGGQASTGGAGGAGGGGQGSNVNVSFTNWPHIGMKLEAAIVSNGNVVQKQTVNDATATTMVTFTGIPDGTHRIHYYADVNDDTNCDAPPADHVWDKEIVVAGASTKTIPHDTDFVNTCATF